MAFNLFPRIRNKDHNNRMLKDFLIPSYSVFTFLWIYHGNKKKCFYIYHMTVSQTCNEYLYKIILGIKNPA